MHLGRFKLLIETEIPSGYIRARDLRVLRHAVKVVGGNAPEAAAISIAAAADVIPQVLVATERRTFPRGRQAGAFQTRVECLPGGRNRGLAFFRLRQPCSSKATKRRCRLSLAFDGAR